MMSNLRLRRLPRPVEIAVFALAICFFVGVLSFANYRYAKDNPGGNDFIPRWLGTRLLLLDGQSPYSKETVLTTQHFFFGRPAKPAEDQALFAYPLYSILIFLPYALIGDFVTARALWLTTLQIALLITALASSRLANWRFSLPLGVGLFLFVLLWYYSVRPMINGNAAILSGLFIALALLAMRNKRDLTAGALFALSTIKPQIVVLLIPALLLWAAYHRRWRLVVGLLVSLAALILFSSLILPDWIIQQLEQVRSYSSYAPIGTPAEIFSQWWPALGGVIGVAFSFLTAIVLIFIWKRSWSPELQIVLPAIFVTLAATNFVGIATATSNYSVLFPGLIMAFALYESRLGRHGRWAVLTLAVLLLIGLWIIFWTTLSGAGQPAVMYFPLPFLLIITFLFLRPKQQPINRSSS